MKKHISLKDAHAILQNCSAVIWGDNFLSYPSVYDLDNNGNSEFLYLKCEDDEGQIFTASFAQNENERVQVSGSSMWLTNDDGDEFQITILNADEKAFNKCENIGEHEVW